MAASKHEEEQLNVDEKENTNSQYILLCPTYLCFVTTTYWVNEYVYKNPLFCMSYFVQKFSSLVIDGGTNRLVIQLLYFERTNKGTAFSIEFMRNKGSSYLFTLPAKQTETEAQQSVTDMESIFVECE